MDHLNTMDHRPEIAAALALGRLPPAGSTADAVNRVARILGKIPRPVTEEEAMALIGLFSADCDRELRMLLVRVVERTPGLDAMMASLDSSNPGIACLRRRFALAQAVANDPQRHLRLDEILELPWDSQRTLGLDSIERAIVDCDDPLRCWDGRCILLVLAELRQRKGEVFTTTEVVHWMGRAPDVSGQVGDDADWFYLGPPERHVFMITFRTGKLAGFGTLEQEEFARIVELRKGRTGDDGMGT